VLLPRRLGLPDVRPGPRKVGLRQAHGCAGRQRAFQLAPMHRLAKLRPRECPLKLYPSRSEMRHGTARRSSGIMCLIGWLQTPETPRTSSTIWRRNSAA
jgi:hypothetical protein